MESTQNTQSKKAKPVVSTPAHTLHDVRPIKLQVIESEEGSTGRIRVRGEFARSDAPTQNGRVYPRGLWEREIGRMNKDLAARKVFGELDHPADGRTQLSRVSHVVTNLHVEEDGTVIGEAEIIDTARGRDLMALLKSGCAVGVSSRGYGSTKSLSDGKEQVQEDYRLGTFDFVAEPADSTAYPTAFFESRENPVDGVLDEAEVARRVSAAVSEATARVEAQLREEFTKKLPILLSKMQTSIREEVKAEFLSDPQVAGAKTALDQLKSVLRPFVLPEDTEAALADKDSEISRLRKTLAEKDLKMKDLEDEQDKLATLARVSGYKYYLERALQGNEDAQLIRTAIGDVAEFANVDSLKQKVESVQREILTKRENARLEEERKAQLIEERVAAERQIWEQERAKWETRVESVEQVKSVAEAREQELTKTVEKLNEALEKTIQASKIQSIMLYAERKIASHPKAAEIRIALDKATLESREEVDALVASFNAVAAPSISEDVEATRARVRRLTRGGSGSLPSDEELPKQPIKESVDYNGLGLDLRTIRKLAGVTG